MVFPAAIFVFVAGENAMVVGRAAAKRFIDVVVVGVVIF